MNTSNYALIFFFACACFQSKTFAQKNIDEEKVLMSTDSVIVLDSTSLLILDLSEDSTKQKRQKKEKVKYYNPNHSPKKAAFLSLAFPGAGQAYNRKYWKLPIVYGGMGTSLFFLIQNAQSLKQNNADLTEAFATNAPNRSLIQANRDISLRNVEISGIIFGALYLLNVVDAVVDAHLMNFDVSDNLTLQINPHILTVNNEVIPALGLNLRL